MNSYSKISKEGKGILSYITTIQHDFLRSRISSWQEHLIRISPFLVQEREWWRDTGSSYELFDGSSTATMESPSVSNWHFRESSLQTNQDRKHKVWQEVLRQEIPLPTPTLRLYDEHGLFTGYREYDGMEIHVHTEMERDEIEAEHMAIDSSECPMTTHTN